MGGFDAAQWSRARGPHGSHETRLLTICPPWGPLLSQSPPPTRVGAACPGIVWQRPYFKWLRKGPKGPIDVLAVVA